MQNSQSGRGFGGTGGFNQTQGSISGNPASLKGKLMNLEVGFTHFLLNVHRKWSRPSKKRWISTKGKFQFLNLKKRLWKVCWPWRPRTLRNPCQTSLWESRRKWKDILLTRRPKTQDFSSKSRHLKEKRLLFNNNSLVRIIQKSFLFF